MKHSILLNLRNSITMKNLVISLFFVICMYHYSIGFSIINMTRSETILEKIINSKEVIKSKIFNSGSFKILNFLSSKLNLIVQSPECNQECSNNCIVQSNYQKLDFQEDYLKKCMEEDCSCFLQNNTEKSLMSVFIHIFFSVVTIFTIYQAYILSLKKPVRNSYNKLLNDDSQLNDNEDANEYYKLDDELIKKEDNMDQYRQNELNGEYNDRLL